MSDPTNADRAEWGKVALRAFSAETGVHTEDLETQLSDLICDLRHFADRGKINWEDVLRRADGHYGEEVNEEKLFYCHKCLELFPIAVLDGAPPVSGDENSDFTDLLCRSCHPNWSPR